jgi:two-component system response regulator MprA
VKPFALEELLARLRSIMRRAAPAADADVLKLADLALDPRTRVATRDGVTIELTRTEYQLLELFLRNAGQVLTRDLIFDRVWGYDFGVNSNSLDVYIGYLRRKTEVDDLPRLIHTVRGVGYIARAP